MPVLRGYRRDTRRISGSWRSGNCMRRASRPRMILEYPNDASQRFVANETDAIKWIPPSDPDSTPAHQCRHSVWQAHSRTWRATRGASCLIRGRSGCTILALDGDLLTTAALDRNRDARRPPDGRPFRSLSLCRTRRGRTTRPICSAR